MRRCAGELTAAACRASAYRAVRRCDAAGSAAPPGAAAAPAAAALEAATFVSEAQAYELLHRLEIAHAPAVTMPLAQAPRELPFDFPVVAKVCSAQIPHKTEVGGVVLNIADAQQLDAAFATLRRNLAERAPGVACDEVLVQPMRSGLMEALIGYRVDPEAGPIVMLAAGGIWAEVAQDRALRLAPVTMETAREMVSEV